MKVSRIYEESTVLTLGARGAIRGEAFVLAGRTCVRGESGGLWNEWLLRSESGEERWLAEASGLFTLYEEAPIAPTWDALAVGSAWATGFVVHEKGQATRVRAWGEADAKPKKYRYADLSSPTGEVATIDWGERAPRVFVGRRVRLAALGLSPRGAHPRFFPAPAGRRGAEPGPLSVGDEGKLAGGRFRVIGIVGRSVRAKGERFAWVEYVLHDGERGVRWLVLAEGELALVERVEPGLVRETERGAVYGGERYAPLSSGKARVDWAVGELPWAASVGDTTRVADFSRGARVLSKEWSDGEVTWSLGAPVPAKTITRAFGKRAPRAPAERAPTRRKTTTAAARGDER